MKLRKKGLRIIIAALCAMLLLTAGGCAFQITNVDTVTPSGDPEMVNTAAPATESDLYFLSQVEDVNGAVTVTLEKATEAQTDEVDASFAVTGETVVVAVLADASITVPQKEDPVQSTAVKTADLPAYFADLGMSGFYVRAEIDNDTVTALSYIYTP